MHVLEESRNLSKELVLATPNANRKRNAENASAYLELIIEANAKKEVRFSLDRYRRSPGAKALSGVGSDSRYSDECSSDNDIDRNRLQLRELIGLQMS
ncbi:hypothetical protein R1flu_000625 [Riccia fluitans]|uniref:Uncharacterized protein n=1 Tax=Riccia fluitans TaxID=41844 RepID=A0ABD1Y1F0_9MARC